MFVFPGMGKEVENLIMENNELLATKYVFHCISLWLFCENVTVLLICTRCGRKTTTCSDIGLCAVVL